MSLERAPSSFVEPHRAGLPLWALPPLQRSSLRLVLDQVRSAYNVGALFRTADGAGVDKIYLLGHTPHPPHPQVEKTALGATTYVPWQYREKFSEVLTELEQDNYELVALDNGPEAENLWEFSWPKRVALVAGNEVDGISAPLLERCSRKVSLPMHGYKRSLNVTTALGIAMFEFLRTQTPREGAL